MEKCVVCLCPGTTGPASERDNVDKLCMDIALWIKCLCLRDIAYRISGLLRPILPAENTDDGGQLDGSYGQEPKRNIFQAK